jgi:hypothetical protein
VQPRGSYQVLKPLQAYRFQILIGEVDLEIAIQGPKEPDHSLSIHLEGIGEEFFDLT